MSLFYVVLTVVYAATLLASLVYVVGLGSTPERIGIAIMVVGSILSVAASSGWTASRIGPLAADLLVLLAFGALALRSERFWPLWVAGFQLTGVATHVAMLVEPSEVLQAYALAQGFWAYPMIAAIVFATWRHRRRPKPSRTRSSRRFFAR